MSDCCFGVSPVNYPDPDPDQISCVASLGVGNGYIVFEADWIKTLVPMATERPH